MKLVSVEQMRRIEKETDALGHTFSDMMEMAGAAVGDVADGVLDAPGSNVLILVGPGNNGGDGLVAAARLRQLGYEITLYVWRRDVRQDLSLRQLRRRRTGLTVLFADNDPGYDNLRSAAAKADLLIDALLGTGASRPIAGSLAAILDTVRQVVADRACETEAGIAQPEGWRQLPLADAVLFGLPPDRSEASTDEETDEYTMEVENSQPVGSPAPIASSASVLTSIAHDDLGANDLAPSPRLLQVIAVDCPTGLNCDTGELDPHALDSDVTVTFAYPKWGHLQEPGGSACGLLVVSDIGVPRELGESLPVDLVEAPKVASLLPRRLPHAHKGLFGKALIAGGSQSYTGAVLLSGSAAVRAGAGLVTLAIPGPLHAAIAGSLPESTWLCLPDHQGALCPEALAPLLSAINAYDALLIGPGLTTDEKAQQFVESLFSDSGLDRDAWSGKVVIDADGLNCIARLPDWPMRLPRVSILTPHPGEMARLTGLSANQVNSQRIALARDRSNAWGHIVLLKGPYSVVAEPSGRTCVLPFALPVLATAGSGDVLAGAIVAFLAQGLSAFDATVCGAYLHAHAGILLERDAHEAPIAAGDLLLRFRKALSQLYSAKNARAPQG